MTYLAGTFIFIITVLLTSCEKESPISEEVSIIEEVPIITEKGTSIIEHEEVVIAEPPNQPINFIDRIVEDVFIKRQCYVGGRFTIEGTVINHGPFPFQPGLDHLFLDINRKDVKLFRVDLRPLQDFLSCEDYYKLGVTYVFPLFITSITAPILNEPLGIGEKPLGSFHVWTRIIVTEELELELRNAGCWQDKD